MICPASVLVSSSRSVQSIIDIHDDRPADFSFSAAVFDGTPGVRFRGGNVTNVAGSSNVVFVRQEVGIDYSSVLILLLVAFLFFRLL